MTKDERKKLTELGLGKTLIAVLDVDDFIGKLMTYGVPLFYTPDGVGIEHAKEGVRFEQSKCAAP